MRKKLITLFMQDDNALPAEYILQPITVKFKYFNDYSDESRDIHKQQREEWWKTYETLQRLLREAAKIAGNTGKMTSSEVHKFYMSGEL